MPPWQELFKDSVCMELRKPGGGLSLEGLSHPFDTILQAGLVTDPDSRHLTLDQLHNTLGIALAVANAQVVHSPDSQNIFRLSYKKFILMAFRPNLTTLSTTFFKCAFEN